jgi:hypothetical protein
VLARSPRQQASFVGLLARLEARPLLVHETARLTRSVVFVVWAPVAVELVVAVFAPRIIGAAAFFAEAVHQRIEIDVV